MPPDIAAQLARNEKRLRAAWGDAIPALSEKFLAQADLAVERIAGGYLRNSPRSAEWTQGIPPAWLTALASAYRHRRDEKYASAARAYYEYWLEKEPVEKGWRPAANYDVLIIPHRLGDTEVLGWFGALPEFLLSPLFDERLLARIVESARVQLNHLADNLYEGRNMRMTQSDALLTEGLRLAFLSDSARWRATGLHALNDAFYRQFHPDGSSVEATGWYHFIVMNMALRFWRLGRAMPELGLQVTRELVAAAFDYLLALVQPDGKLNRIGDCTAHLTYDGTLASVIAHREAVRRELGLPAAALSLSQFFPCAKQAVLRDGWGSEATCVTFDATCRVGYHWHPARNAIQLHLAGSRVIADPGRMAYNSTPHRRYAASTRAHSTMNLNGWNQSPAEPSFRFRSIVGYDIVDSLYEGGYWPGDGDNYRPGLFAGHHRTLLWSRGRFIVVIDNLYNTSQKGEKPTIESNWQFAPGIVRLDSGSRRVFTQHGQARMLMLFPLMPAAMTMTLHEGATNPILGWVADDSDEPVPAPLLRLAVEEFDPWNIDLATLLIPFNENTAPDVTVLESVDPAEAGYGKMILRWADGTTDEIYWKRRLRFALDQVDDLHTDSALVHLQETPSGSLLKAFVYDGSFLAPYMPRWLPSRATFAVGPDGKAIAKSY